MEGKSQNRFFRILYFSGTGNTEWVVKKIAGELKTKKFECELLAADQLQADCGRCYESNPDELEMRLRLKKFIPPGTTLILAFPARCIDIPLPLKQLIPLLPDDGERELAVVSTIYISGGDTCNIPEKLLSSKGYRSILATYVKMPNNLKIPKAEMYDIKNGVELKTYYETAGKAVSEIVEELITGKARFEGKTIADYIAGCGYRNVDKNIHQILISKFFILVNCMKCTSCAAICPMGNITFKRGFPEIGDDCCACMRCYNSCPMSSIQVTDATIDERKYPRYRGFDGWKVHYLRTVDRSPIYKYTSF